MTEVTAATPNVDAILQRLMPPGRAPGDLACSSNRSRVESFDLVDDEDSPPAAKRDKRTIGLFSSFEDTTGDVSEFLIFNSPLSNNNDALNSNVFNDNNGNGPTANVTGHSNNDDVDGANRNRKRRVDAASGKAVPLRSSVPSTRKPSANLNQSTDSVGIDPTTAVDLSPSELTERLLAVLEMSPTRYVDLETITGELDSLQRRVLLDIVSVLEGLDVVDMPLSNVIKWRGDSSALIVEQLQRIADIRGDVGALAAHEHELDTHIRWLQQSLLNVCENKDNDRLAYTTHEDIIRLFPDRFNVAVCAPTSATIDTNIVSASGLGGNNNNNEDGKHLVYELIVRCKSNLPKAYVLSMDGHAAYQVDE